MPFHFQSKRQEAAARRKKYVLATIALLLAIAILVGWLVVSYHRTAASEKPEEESSLPAPPVEEPADTASSLLILKEEETLRLVLVQFAPATHRAYTLPIPANLDCGGQKLSDILQKEGSPRVKKAVAAALGIPITHHITMSITNMERYLNYLESGVTYTLPEAATYPNDSLVEATIPAGEQHLAANQVSGLLRYNKWSKKDTAHTVAAELVAAILNQYLIPDHRFDGDYATLANLMTTDIRIDHYTAYVSTLEKLADYNTDGILCTALPIHGTEQDGLFRLDRNTLKESPLYDE